jgi:hypothetical protein
MERAPKGELEPEVEPRPTEGKLGKATPKRKATPEVRKALGDKAIRGKRQPSNEQRNAIGRIATSRQAERPPDRER